MKNSLSRKRDYRKSLIRNLTTSLILYEEIKTTLAKAKVLRAEAESLIIAAKKNDLVARRRLLGCLFDKKAVQKVFEVLVPRYKKINSGIISIVKIGPRLGDNAEMAIVKLAPGEEKKSVDQSKDKDGKPNQKITTNQSTGAKTAKA